MLMKKKNGTDKYDVPVRRTFRWASEQQSCSAEASMIVRIPAPWLTKEIIFVCTVFLSFTLWNSRLWDEYLQDNTKTQSASLK